MAKIAKVLSREILDSRANPTVEVKIILDDGYFGSFAFPQGASISRYEPKVLNDNDLARFQGRGVQKAVNAVASVFAPKLVGLDAKDQKKIDDVLISIDSKKEKYGANSMLPISLAVVSAQAASERTPLYQYLWANFFKSRTISVPVPIFSYIDGGLHGNINLEFQEFLLLPASSYSYQEGLIIGVEIYQTLKKILKSRNEIRSVGHEGGFAPNLFANAEAIEVINEAATQAGYEPGRDIFYGIDVSASHFYESGHYRIKDRANPMTVDEFVDFYKETLGRFRLLFLEDPLSSDDWEGWKYLTATLGGQLMVASGEALTANQERIGKAVKENMANAVVLNPTYAGTLTELVGAIGLAASASWKIIFTSRAGDTGETFVCDLACACGADYVKFGAPARGERVIKYNRLSEIYGSLQSSR